MANKSDNIIREEARAIEVGEETGGTPQQRRQRDSWASRTGFILACVGSAVGMANIWLFPYRVAQLGGVGAVGDLVPAAANQPEGERSAGQHCQHLFHCVFSSFSA